jgi:hypothetical protein
MLLSYINTQLRDQDGDLESLCRRLDADPGEIKEKLASVGYTYNEATHQFK